MEREIAQAATWPWVLGAAGFIAWAMWAARRRSIRFPSARPQRVTDVVCGMTIEVGRAAAKREYGGKTFYFCSEACQKRFAADPSKFTHRPSSEEAI